MKRALVLATLFMSGIAHADVYGYVDANGMTHLATERLDDNYILFVKGDANAAAPVDRAPDPSLMQSKLFKRLVDHPNIAKYQPLVDQAAKKHGLDPMLVKAVIAVESGFEPSAVSEKGAIGLMQVLPATGERYGLRADKRRSVEQKLADPAINLDIGTRYLADLRAMFAARPELALAAYNAGENTVIRYRHAVPPYPETQAYVRLVDQFHAFYAPAKTTTAAHGQRIKVTIAARRNLPDPARAAQVVIPASPPSPDIDERSDGSAR